MLMKFHRLAKQLILIFTVIAYPELMKRKCFIIHQLYTSQKADQSGLVPSGYIHLNLIFSTKWLIFENCWIIVMLLPILRTLLFRKVIKYQLFWLTITVELCPNLSDIRIFLFYLCIWLVHSEYWLVGVIISICTSQEITGYGSGYSLN